MKDTNAELSALVSHVQQEAGEGGLQNVPSTTTQLFLQTCFNSSVRFHSQKDIPYKIKLKLSFIQILYFFVTHIKDINVFNLCIYVFLFYILKKIHTFSF